MNDPGVEQPIVDVDQAVSGRKESLTPDHDPLSAESKIDKNTTTATRWWYASTGFPLLAGTFGPMANAFSISALVGHWRVNIVQSGVETIPDPSWLIIVNAISLVMALIANLSLLLNMAKRVRFEVAQPITILGFWTASILLIGLVVKAGTDQSFHVHGSPSQALSQAYYYAIYAAGLYQIISYLMCVTVYGAYRGVFTKDFELTPAQRTLMLQTISFLLYMHLGALVFGKIEGWAYLDAVYWADFTLLTVGIGGKYVPTTHLARGLLFPFAIGGIIIIGLVVSSIRSMVVERGAQHMSARMKEKVRRRAVRQIQAVQQHKKTVSHTARLISPDVAHKIAEQPSTDVATELDRRQTEFEVMRRVQEVAQRERQYTALFCSTLAFAILWFVGAAIFAQCEADQEWTYYAGLYFAYTSILTIGYGDLTPESEAGKPFFVFWSLLAVPTLTVLISDMGDTVVKAVKDVTIYIGEISVLPSNDDRTVNRFKYGLARATGGLFNFDVQQRAQGSGKEPISADMEEKLAGFKELHPGLIPLFDSGGSHVMNQSDVQTLEKLAKVLNLQENASEVTAREHHDRKMEAEHHYRRILIAQIPIVYAQTKSAEPKKYSYIEWAFYLRLLGEAESDGSNHRLAQVGQRHKKRGIHHTSRQGDSSNGDQQSEESELNKKQSGWSWIGQRSPLMSSQTESEWILEKLFERLEESFSTQSRWERRRSTSSLPGQTLRQASSTDSQKTNLDEVTERETEQLRRRADKKEDVTT